MIITDHDMWLLLKIIWGKWCKKRSQIHSEHLQPCGFSPQCCDVDKMTEKQIVAQVPSSQPLLGKHTVPSAQTLSVHPWAKNFFYLFKGYVTCRTSYTYSLTLYKKSSLIPRLRVCWEETGAKELRMPVEEQFNGSVLGSSWLFISLIPVIFIF